MLLLGGGSHRVELLVLLWFAAAWWRLPPGKLLSCFAAVVVGRLVDPHVVAAAGRRLHPGKTFLSCCLEGF